MKKQSKFIKFLVITVLILLSLYMFHLLNSTFPNNIINKVIKGFFIVFTPALVALFITYLMEPLMHHFQKRWKFNKILSIITTMFIVIAIVAGFSAFIILFAFQQSKSMIDFVINSNLVVNLERIFTNAGMKGIYDFIYDYVVNFDYSILLGNITSGLFTILGQTLTIIILIPIFLWYFLSARKEIFINMGKLVPNNYQDDVYQIANKSNEVIIAYFKSKVISMVFLFFAFFIFFLIMGLPIPYVLFFAMIITIFDLIPYIGPFVGNALPVIYVFANSGTNIFYSYHISGLYAAIILIVINLVIQFIQGNIIMPKIAGKEMNIHPLIILSAMLFFGNVLGVWGVLLSIPLSGIIIVVYKHYKEKDTLNNNLEKDTNSNQETSKDVTK